VDLFEYSAKESSLITAFPPQGKVATTPEQAATSRPIHRGGQARGRDQGPGQGRRPRKAGGLKLASTAPGGRAKAQGHPRHDIKVTRSIGTGRRGHRHQRGIIPLLPPGRAEPHVPVDVLGRGGVEIEEVARTSPQALARIPVSPLAGVDAEQAAQIVEAGRLPRRHGLARPRWPADVGGVHTRGRHPGRGQPRSC